MFIFSMVSAFFIVIIIAAAILGKLYKNKRIEQELEARRLFNISLRERNQRRLAECHVANITAERRRYRNASIQDNPYIDDPPITSYAHVCAANTVYEMITKSKDTEDTFTPGGGSFGGGGASGSYSSPSHCSDGDCGGGDCGGD